MDDDKKNSGVEEGADALGKRPFRLSDVKMRYNYVTDPVTPERYQVGEEESAEASAKLEHLEGSVNETIEYYEKRNSKNKFRAFIFKFVSAGLSAVVTILLGINFKGYEQLFNSVALSISASVTVIAGMQAFFDYQELWVKYTETLDQLKILKESIEYVKLSGKALRLKDVEQLKMTYDEIVQQTSEFLIQVRADDINH